jgi:lipid-A-disaccharide synthase-like uncharacterized protein
MEWLTNAVTEWMNKPMADKVWLGIGMFGEVIFGMRFIVQWIATEKQKKSVIPLAFWYLSLLGSVILLAYAVYLKNPVFILGFSLNLAIYLRNLFFIHFHKHPDVTSEED